MPSKARGRLGLLQVNLRDSRPAHGNPRPRQNISAAHTTTLKQYFFGIQPVGTVLNVFSLVFLYRYYLLTILRAHMFDNDINRRFLVKLQIGGTVPSL